MAATAASILRGDPRLSLRDEVAHRGPFGDTVRDVRGHPRIAVVGNRIIGDCGSSEIDDLKPLVDALNKSLADMTVTSEYVGRPRRWATGIELTEEPVLDVGRPPQWLDEDGAARHDRGQPDPRGSPGDDVGEQRR